MNVLYVLHVHVRTVPVHLVLYLYQHYGGTFTATASVPVIVSPLL